MEEIWVDIDGYSGLYQISTFGRVRSLDREVRTKGGSMRIQRGRVLKLFPDYDGYYDVGLHKDGKFKGFRVNRLVALTFIPNPENKPIVHHIDHNKQNNRVDNLAWATASENTNAAIKAGKLTFDRERLTKISRLGVKKTSKPVIDSEGNIFPSQMAADRHYGFNEGSVSYAIHTREGQFKGLKFKYLKDL